MEVSRVLLLSIMSASAVAHAGDNRAKIACSVDSAPKPIKGAAKMGKELNCLVSPNLSSLPTAAQAHASAWITFPNQKGAPRKVTADAMIAEGDAAFFQVGGFARNADFKGCVDFVVHGEIFNDNDVLWSGELPIKTACDKPKPIAGKFACHYTAGDHTTYTWPGNGAKVKPRLVESTGLTCGFTTKDKKSDGLVTSWFLTGKKDAAKASDLRCMAGECTDEVTFTPGDYDECASFTVEYVALDADDREVIHLKQKIVQDCPD